MFSLIRQKRLLLTINKIPVVGEVCEMANLDLNEP